MPAGRVVLLPPTVNEVPVPVSGAGVESDNQGVGVVAVHVTGREQVPDSLSRTVAGFGDGCPWAAVKVKLETGAATQGGSTVKVAVTCCGLLVATMPALSVAEMVKLALSGGPLVNPAVEAVTAKGID